MVKFKKTMNANDTELSLLRARIRAAKMTVPAFEYPYNYFSHNNETAVIFHKKSYGIKLSKVLEKHHYDFTEIMPHYGNDYFKYEIIIH